MIDYSIQNKIAWEYNAYDFWVKEAGLPADRAKKIVDDPCGALKRYANYFDTYKDVRVADICGSCGKKAVPLGVLGAKVCVFDISEDNKRYAMELADAAGVQIDYQVCDVLEIDMAKFGGTFDVVFMEGGVLHYFHDIDQFMGIMYCLLKPGGKLICSDFHPFVKVMDTLELQQPTIGDVCFHYTPEKDWWDMGIVIFAPFRGKGYAVPALKLLLDHAFRDCGISRLHNDFETTRDAALAIHRKVGFKEMGMENGILQLMLTKEDYLSNNP